MKEARREAVIGMLKAASADTAALWRAVVEAGLTDIPDGRTFGRALDLVDMAFDESDPDILLAVALKLVPAGRWATVTICRNADTPDRIVAHAKLSADADTLDRDLLENEPFDIEANNAPSPAIAVAMAALEAQSWEALASDTGMPAGRQARNVPAHLDRRLDGSAG